MHDLLTAFFMYVVDALLSVSILMFFSRFFFSM